MVLDASAAVEWFQRRALADAVERRILASEVVHVPHVWFLEVAQVTRRHVAAGVLDAAGGARLLQVADDLPAHRHPHEPLRERIWQLRADLTAYDAAYVALAEALDVPLVTTDAMLARSPGHRARVDLISA